MIVLVRLDERLIHGQVVVGWSSLAATAFVVVDDPVVASDWERDLVLAGVPDDAAGDVVTVAEAIEAWPEWRSDKERRLIIVQSVRTLDDLLAGGVPLGHVNVGGLHQRPGRREFLTYVHLDPAELAACRRLCHAGVHLEARNVPGACGVDLCAMVAGKG